MSPEKHLAAILTAWHASNGSQITFEMREALMTAESDFDGVDEYVDFNDYRKAD